MLPCLLRSRKVVGHIILKLEGNTKYFPKFFNFIGEEAKAGSVAPPARDRIDKMRLELMLSVSKYLQTRETPNFDAI